MTETKTPVVLIIDCRGTGNSAGAVIEGFLRYRKDNFIKGVIFNNLNEARYADMARLAARAGACAYGFLPYDAAVFIKSRNLGLIPPSEIEGLKEKLCHLGETAKKTLDIDGLIKLSRTAPFLDTPPKTRPSKKSVRIAVARDRAFCFRYIENFELLEDAGADIVYFSPLNDAGLPPDIGGLYICGGYPELYAKELSSNKTMLCDIKNAIKDGMPVIAEGGGFLTLHETLDGFPMVGAILGHASKTEKLQGFGYCELTAKRDNLLCKAGEKIRAHEFRYCDSDAAGDGFIARKAGSGAEYHAAHATQSLYAGFPYLYLPARREAAKRFVAYAKEYMR